MIEATIELLNEKGYYGTSTNEILARSKAPRGSMYYHFPGGKDEIIIAAINSVGEMIAHSLQQIYENIEGPEQVVEAVFAFFRQQLLQSEFACGCPISAVALECSGTQSPISEACKSVYKRWEESLFDYLNTHLSRASKKKASPSKETTIREGATLLFSLIEGALLVARSTAEIAPLDIAQRHALRLIQQEV